VVAGVERIRWTNWSMTQNWLSRPVSRL